jgi:hypothetical protein
MRTAMPTRQVQARPQRVIKHHVTTGMQVFRTGRTLQEIKTAKNAAPLPDTAAVEAAPEHQNTGAFGYRFTKSLWGPLWLASWKDAIIDTKEGKIGQLTAMNKDLELKLRVAEMRLQELGVQHQALKTRPSPAVQAANEARTLMPPHLPDEVVRPSTPVQDWDAPKVQLDWSPPKLTVNFQTLIDYLFL